MAVRSIRHNSVAVSMARHLGIKRLAIPTAGNAGGALAVYAARADMEAFVFMPEDTPIINQLEAHLANHDLAAFWTIDVEPELLLADMLDEPPPQPEISPPDQRPFMNRFEFRIFDAQRRGFLSDARRARAESFRGRHVSSDAAVDASRRRRSRSGG